MGPGPETVLLIKSRLRVIDSVFNSEKTNQPVLCFAALAAED